jgi:hypothetical protein
MEIGQMAKKCGGKINGWIAGYSLPVSRLIGGAGKIPEMISITERTDVFEGGELPNPGVEASQDPGGKLKRKFLGARQPDGAGQRPEALNPRGAPSNFYR